NSTGKLIVRTQGTNQLAIDNTGLNLVNNGKLTKAATGLNDLLPACYGAVNADGTLISGTPNMTVTHTVSGNGQYYINFPGIGPNAVALITPRSSNRTSASAMNPGVGIWVGFTNSGVYTDTPFNFVIFNP
ncbi:MAG TPA: hypothetical protein VLA25_05860, partial [Methylotenera sp.]|nr:hypothetical protein [Methylotenera sp.]